MSIISIREKTIEILSNPAQSLQIARTAQSLPRIPLSCLTLRACISDFTSNLAIILYVSHHHMNTPGAIDDDLRIAFIATRLSRGESIADISTAWHDLALLHNLLTKLRAPLDDPKGIGFAAYYDDDQLDSEMLLSREPISERIKVADRDILDIIAAQELAKHKSEDLRKVHRFATEVYPGEAPRVAAEACKKDDRIARGHQQCLANITDEEVMEELARVEHTEMRLEQCPHHIRA